MPILFSHTIRRTGRDYKVDFSFDDQEIMNNTAAFEIKASVKEADSDQWQDITLRIDVNLAEELLEISHDGRPIAKLPLNLPLNDGVADTVSDIDVNQINEKIIDEAIGRLGIEEILHLLPGDPFFGCIIKGATSTAIGQIIRCWRPNRHIRPLKDLAYRIGSCLRDNVTRMLFTFIYRTGRCAVLCGAG